jgi:sugar phosphate isomerase/epimerase
MGYEFSLAHLTVLKSSPPEMVKIAAETGYQFVSLRMTAVTPTEPVYGLTDDPAMMRETKSLLADTGVRVLDIELARMDPKTEPETYLPFLQTGAELGARHVITQLPDPDRNRAMQRFARLCDLAKPLGLTIDLEFPSWTETPDLAAAAAVLKAVEKPNAGILVDILHFARSNSSRDELRSLPREWFHFVHLCDVPKKAPATTDGIIHAARSERYFPGEGGLNPRKILDCMPVVPYSLEIPHDRRIKELGALEYARQAIRVAGKYLEENPDSD